MRYLFYLVLLLPAATYATEQITDNEREFIRQELNDELAGRELLVEVDKLNELAWARRVQLTLMPARREFRQWDGTRVDVITPHHAIEVEWASKWSQSFGQAGYYAATNDTAPAVVLLVKNMSKDERYVYRGKVTGEALDIPVWVVDTQKNVLHMQGEIFTLIIPGITEKVPGDVASNNVSLQLDRDNR